VEGDVDAKLEGGVVSTVETRVRATPNEPGRDWSAITEKSQRETDGD